MASFGKKIQKIKHVGELPKSKLTSTSGVGALVEFPGFSGIMGGLDKWEIPVSRLKIHERTLEKRLNKEYFVQAGDSKSEEWKHGCSVPVYRFPEYYYCPECHDLDYAAKLAINYRSNKTDAEALLCSRCKVELIASRFVVACIDGHIDDFPYQWWVHRGADHQGHKLSLENIGKSGGLESILVSCLTCGKKRTMAGCLSKEAVTGMMCHGNQPWFGPNKSCSCDKEIRVLMRGSNNIYYPEIAKALTIPPWSNAIEKLLNDDFEGIKNYFLSGIPQDILEKCLSLYYSEKKVGERCNCSKEEFIFQAKGRFGNSGLEKIVDTDYCQEYEEYRAFTGPDKDDTYFKTESVKIAKELQPYISKVKLIKRLREVQVLTGFKRIVANGEGSGLSAPISEKHSIWLPANELLGEGIFIEFSKEAMNRWKARNDARFEKMHKRYNNQNLAPRMGTFDAAYVCIHSFSHLLMRELSYNCGYESAAIQEKVYACSDPDQYMMGLMIYTASSCSDGSLGGLVRQGQTEVFQDTILSMLDKASWCSNDPICIEAMEQGRYSLNYAACHACMLVPETACENGNILLDRNAVVGSFQDQGLGLMGELLGQK